MNDKRSHHFIRNVWAREHRRPFLWILLTTILFQIFQSGSASLFGMEQAQTMDLQMLGFSPEQPGRLVFLPWLFSWSVHLGWEHLLVNLAAFAIFYLLTARNLSTKTWWLLILCFQVSTNLIFFLVTLISHQLDISPLGSPNLYLGLSGICFSLLGFFSRGPNSYLRWMAVIAVLIELTQIISSHPAGLAGYSHLIAMAVGFTAARSKSFSSLLSKR